MKNRNRSLFVSTAMLALSAFLAACSATPLPPLFVSPPTAGAQSASAATAQPTEQPAVPTAVSLTASEPTVAATPVQVEATQPPAATVEPTSTSTQVAPTAVPTAQKQAQAKPTVKPTRAVATAAATRIPTRAPARPTATRVKPTPTPEWPKTLTVTAQQLEEQAGSVPGLQVTGLNVTFDNNSMTLSADRLRYSIVSIRNLVVQGHFTASNCDVTFVADSIQPRNLATSSIPNIVNQSLDQQLGQWCVETISIAPGELVATVRPR